MATAAGPTAPKGTINSLLRKYPMEGQHKWTIKLHLEELHPHLLKPLMEKIELVLYGAPDKPNRIEVNELSIYYPCCVHCDSEEFVGLELLQATYYRKWRKDIVNLSGECTLSHGLCRPPS